jgi:hypothetical protein
MQRKISWTEGRTDRGKTESTDNIGLPTYTTSPIQKNQTHSSSTTKKKQGKNKKDTHTSKKSEPLRVLTINFQSIKNKKPEVELIESCKPSIIFGTETWLSNDISPYEYIPSSKYNIYTTRSSGEPVSLT